MAFRLGPFSKRSVLIFVTGKRVVHRVPSSKLLWKQSVPMGLTQGSSSAQGLRPDRASRYSSHWQARRVLWRPSFSSDATVNFRLHALRDGSSQVVGWSLYAPDQAQVETYDTGGRLLSFASLDGGQKRITYVASGMNSLSDDAPVCRWRRRRCPWQSLVYHGSVRSTAQSRLRRFGCSSVDPCPSGESILYEVDGPSAAAGQRIPQQDELPL